MPTNKLGDLPATMYRSTHVVNIRIRHMYIIRHELRLVKQIKSSMCVFWEQKVRVIQSMIDEMLLCINNGGIIQNN